MTPYQRKQAKADEKAGKASLIDLIYVIPLLTPYLSPLLLSKASRAKDGHPGNKEHVSRTV